MDPALFGTSVTQASEFRAFLQTLGGGIVAHATVFQTVHTVRASVTAAMH